MIEINSLVEEVQKMTTIFQSRCVYIPYQTTNGKFESSVYLPFPVDEVRVLETTVCSAIAVANASAPESELAFFRCRELNPDDTGFVGHHKISSFNYNGRYISNLASTFGGEYRAVFSKPMNFDNKRLSFEIVVDNPGLVTWIPVGDDGLPVSLSGVVLIEFIQHAPIEFYQKDDGSKRQRVEK